jgi:hypothetical protein
MSGAGPLPTFLIIGAMKSGSTSLFNHLREHPRVYLTPYKEPEFFVAEKQWGRGVEWYRRLFADAGDALAVGEGSTAYTKPTEFAGVPQRIRSVVPDVRLVYILRDPVERIRSMYEHMVLVGGERRPIDEAVLADPKYLGPSLYAHNLALYLEHFPREQLHVALTEDLRSDPVSTLAGVTAFLGLPPVDLVPRRRVDLATADRRPDRRIKTMLREVPAAHLVLHRLPAPVRDGLRRLTTRPATGERPQLSGEVEDRLRDRLRPDVAELRTLLGPGAPSWGLLD